MSLIPKGWRPDGWINPVAEARAELHHFLNMLPPLPTPFLDYGEYLFEAGANKMLEALHRANNCVPIRAGMSFSYIQDLSCGIEIGTHDVKSLEHRVTVHCDGVLAFIPDDPLTESDETHGEPKNEG